MRLPLICFFEKFKSALLIQKTKREAGESMAVTHIRPEGTQSTCSTKNNQQAVEKARQAAYQLLAQFETFLEGIFEHQIKQGHFIQRYDIPARTASEYSPVQGPRYKSFYNFYSNDKKRIESVEALNETLHILEDLYDSIPDDYSGAWQVTIKKLDMLVLNNEVYQLVEEYLDTLPAGNETPNKRRCKKEYGGLPPSFNSTSCGRSTCTPCKSAF
jgi:hypothetical protein